MSAAGDGSAPAAVSFAALLRRQRLAAGLTQEALAGRAALSTRAVSDLERGVKQAPRFDTVRRLLAALALHPEAAAALAAAARPAGGPDSRATSDAAPARVEGAQRSSPGRVPDAQGPRAAAVLSATPSVCRYHLPVPLTSLVGGSASWQPCGTVCEGTASGCWC